MFLSRFKLLKENIVTQFCSILSQPNIYCNQLPRELLVNYNHALRCQNKCLYSSKVVLSIDHPLPKTSCQGKKVFDDIINVTENTEVKAPQKTVISLAKPTKFMKKINILSSSTILNSETKKNDVDETQNVVTDKPNLNTNLPTKSKVKRKKRPTRKSVDESDQAIYEGPKKCAKLPISLRKKSEQQLLFASKLNERKNIALNTNIKVFLSVCGQSNDYVISRKAFELFDSLIAKHKEVLNIETINEVFKCAQTMDEIQMVVNTIKESGKKPTLDTFLNIFVCLGRLPEDSNSSNELKNTIAWMQEQGITIQNLLSNGIFLKDSFQECVDAISRIEPDTSMNFDCINSNLETLQAKYQYDNVLVNDLNSSLLTNNFVSPFKGVLSNDELHKCMEDQLSLEINGFGVIKSVMKDNDPENTKVAEEIFMKWEEEWREKIKESIETQKSHLRNNFIHSKPVVDIYPFIASVDTEDIVNLLILEIHQICRDSFHLVVPLGSLERSIGMQFFNRYVIMSKKDRKRLENLKNAYGQYLKYYGEGSEKVSSPIPRVQWEKIIAESGTNILKDCPVEWPHWVKNLVGKLIYSTIFVCLTVSDPNSEDKSKVPAFSRVHVAVDNRAYDKVTLSPILSKIYGRFQASKLILSPLDFPLMSPSLPWLSPESGGYLLSRSNLVRTTIPSEMMYDSSDNVDSATRSLFPVLDSLNQLGSIPWIINKSMLDLVIQLFNNDGWDDLDLCSQSFNEEPPPELESNASFKQKIKYTLKIKNYKKRKREHYSNMCNTLYKLSLSNHFRDRVFWLPNNLDFRGRVYPIPPHLTHLSADVFRSILLFAKGKPLGADGLKWLKIHVINLTGLKKKCSVAERLSFAEEVLDEIYDSADNPIDGRQWWTKSDEPWQTLAVCKDLTAAMRSGDPENYISHLPIHQDGSCNGLQHYAALGRDTFGAKSVNLAPSEFPQDIYSDVVKAVEERRQIDAKNGLPMALALENYVTRKVIKQTIMTTVYGVTQFGAKLQIEKQLKYLNFSPKICISASSYLCSVVFSCLENLFTPTKKIQDWFVLCAQEISKDFGCNVEWTTPLGFHVYQPYQKNSGHRSNLTNLMGVLPFDKASKPDAMKNKNAFPPNFIHSLDSCHMMLTSIYCQDKKIFFASIHDCFWTHASDVNTMSEICRDQFVELHSLPILEDLSQSFIHRYKHHLMKGKGDLVEDTILKKIPDKGTFDINEVKKSVFFFS